VSLKSLPAKASVTRAKIPPHWLLSKAHQEKWMASRKKPSQAVFEMTKPEPELLEYVTSVEQESPVMLTSNADADRETQVREAAYAAYERRGGQGGDPAQDWLDAEAAWERQQSR
jgi:hypothetical protein